MKSFSMLWIAICLFLFCCVCEDNVEPITQEVLQEEDNPPSILDGVYQGEQRIQVVIWTGKDQENDTLLIYPFNFSINGNKFIREECGICEGNIEIDSSKQIVRFISDQPGCVSKYSKNPIVDSFNYKIEEGKITIYRSDPPFNNEELAQKYGIGSGLLHNTITVQRVNANF